MKDKEEQWAKDAEVAQAQAEAQEEVKSKLKAQFFPEQKSESVDKAELKPESFDNKEAAE